MNERAVPRVKICGLTRPGDAAMVAAAGADFVGVILAPGFRRSLALERAATVLDAAGACLRVGVFVDPSTEEITDAVGALRLDVVQLHGAEPPSSAVDARRAGAAAWKAVRPRSEGDVRRAVADWGDRVDGLLLDGYSPRAAGGVGARFDWAAAAAEWPAGSGPRRIVAGGLTPANVCDAVERLAPDVVDVSSGVERTPGRKDATLVAGFLAAVATRAGAA
ncbi:MAG TPA: phosphoribosylanthranilate isomerase [Longimicrobiales bacterium]|nr:phosphoribosylanthranilate isomerase [Longimicrobiales bacterium]